jgi:integrase
MGRGPGVRAVGGAIQVDFTYRGRRCRERLRLEPTKSNLKYAEQLKARIEHEIALGTFDYAKYFPGSKHARTLTRDAGAVVLVKDLIGDWLKIIEAEVEPETFRKYSDDAQAWQNGEIGKRPIGAVRRDEVRLRLGELKLSRKRLNNLLIPLRGAFKLATERGQIATNPIRGLELKRPAAIDEDDDIDPFTPAEIAVLDAGPLGELWSFWAATGLRTGEIIALRWTDVEQGRLRVARARRQGREKAPKTRAGLRYVRLLPPALLALRRVPKVSESVFVNPNTGEPFHSDKPIRELFGRVCAQLGVRYRYPYQLRHTFASLSLSVGENPLWVAKQMGHKDPTLVLRVYARYVPTVDPEAGQKFAALWQPDGTSGRKWLKGMVPVEGIEPPQPPKADPDILN